MMIFLVVYKRRIVYGMVWYHMEQVLYGTILTVLSVYLWCRIVPKPSVAHRNTSVRRTPKMKITDAPVVHTRNTRVRMQSGKATAAANRHPIGVDSDLAWVLPESLLKP